MSAFIVSEKCMNLVVNAILERASGERTFAGVSLQDGDAGQRIGDLLFAMNTRAMDARYGDRWHSDKAQWGQDTVLYRHSLAWQGNVLDPMPSTRRIAAFKAVQCLLYQCAEGTVDEEPLYKELEQFTAHLAYRIISQLPGFEEADWG